MVSHIIRLADLSNHVGRYLGVSGWTAIGQAQTDAFGALTGDEEWIHVDVDRATRERGGTIVHGYHLLSLIPTLIEQIFRIEDLSHGLNYGIDKLRFTEPVRPGDRLRLHATVRSVIPRGDAVILMVDTKVEIEGNARPAMIAACLLMLVPAAWDRT